MAATAVYFDVPVISRDGRIRAARSLTGWFDAFPQSHTRAYAPMRAATVRSCERIGWQAKAPAPQKRKPLSTKMGQTLSSVNPAIEAIFSHVLRERFPVKE